MRLPGWTFLFALFLLAAAAVLIAVAPDQERGATMNGTAAYWQAGGWTLIADPFRYDYATGSKPQGRTELSIENDGTSEQLSCAFMFEERPEKAKLSMWKNITSAQLVAQQNGTHPNGTAIISYSLQNITEPGWSDITEQLTLGQYQDWHYGAGMATVAGTKRFLLEYTPNASDDSGKWEMWCWKGNLSSPQNIIKLDPTWQNVTVDLQQGLAFRYEFNGSASAAAALLDSGPGAYHLTNLSGGIVRTADDLGRANQAVMFDGLVSMGRLVNNTGQKNLSSPGTPFTLLAVFKLNTTVADDDYLLGRGQISATTDQSVLTAGNYGGANRFRFGAVASEIGDVNVVSPTNSVAFGTWMCWAGYGNASTGAAATIFSQSLNGTLQDVAQSTGTGAPRFANTTIFAGTGSGGNGQWNGSLALFTMYNRQLNATEADALCNGVSPFDVQANAQAQASFAAFSAGSFATNDTLRCGGIVTDADGDNITVNITFLRNGTLINSSIFPGVVNGSFINVTLSDTALYNRSDAVNCTVQANDSGAPQWTSNLTRIVNAEPSLLGAVNLTADDGGLNRTLANLTVSFACSDADAGDSCNATQRIYWWLGQANRTDLQNSSVVGAGNTTRGDVWLAGVQLSDGWNASSLTAFLNASNLTILNSPPGAPALSSPANGSNVSATEVSFSWAASVDDDADAVNYTWWLDGGNRRGDITALGVTVDIEAGFHNWSVMASDADLNSANSTFALFQEGGGPGPSGGGGGGITLPLPVLPENATVAERLQAFSFRGWLGDLWSWLRLSISSQRPTLQVSSTGEQQLVYSPPPVPEEVKASLRAIPPLVWLAGFIVAVIAVYAAYQFIILGLILPGVQSIGGWPALIVSIAVAVLIAWLTRGG